MVSLDREGLNQYRAELRSHLSQKEAQQVQLGTEIVELREKLEAVNCLIGKDGNHSDKSAVSVPTAGHETPRYSGSGSRGRRGSFTPVYVYWPAILVSLKELGGSASGDEVIERVGRKLNTVLTPADREMLPSGTDIRWRNRVQWQRYNMLKQGLLKRDSPRGIWEITDDGRRWVDEVEKRLQAPGNH